MSDLRTISAIVADDKGNNIRTATDKRSFVVVDCKAELSDGVLYPSERKAFFADQEILDLVEVGMKIKLD